MADGKQACCPICGAGVRATIIVGAVQDDNGVWSVEQYADADVNDLIDNPNQEVECTNEHCGNPFDDRGIEIDLQGMNEFEFWRAHQDPNIVPINTSYEELSDELKEQFKLWAETLTYSPWCGCLGDCITLEGTKYFEDRNLAR